MSTFVIILVTSSDNNNTHVKANLDNAVIKCNNHRMNTCTSNTSITNCNDNDRPACCRSHVPPRRRRPHMYHRWNRNPRPHPQTFSKLVCLLWFSWFYICLDWLSGVNCVPFKSVCSQALLSLRSCQPLPCNPVAETPILPLIWCSDSLSFPTRLLLLRRVVFHRHRYCLFVLWWLWLLVLVLLRVWLLIYIYIYIYMIDITYH